MSYKATIGLEIHVELKTKSKMFCGCKNEPHAESPNIHICPVCLAHPGTLPQVNTEAVKLVLLAGQAVEGKLATYSEFDRKNYFYPDIPKAYQLSQQAFPFVSGGNYAGVEITRIHLEEDTARSQHSDSGSIVDFNRSGVPLMELVTEPVIHDASTAVYFAKELQLLLRTLGVSDANMEMGEMRVEANISVSQNDDLGVKVEVKNLNSFKSVEQAIIYETTRQSSVLEKGGTLVQETRGWDEQKGVTFSQRTKETADDYRYFPDPDIPKYDLLNTKYTNSRLSEIIPETPNKIRARLNSLSIRELQIEILLQKNDLLDFFDETLGFLENSDIKQVNLAVNYLTSDIQNLLDDQGQVSLHTENAQLFANLVVMISKKEIGSRVAKDLLPEVVFEGKDPREMAEKRGLLQSTNEEALRSVVGKILADNPAAVEDYRAGKETAVKYLLGQGMKETRGGADPEVLLKLIKDEL